MMARVLGSALIGFTDSLWSRNVLNWYLASHFACKKSIRIFKEIAEGQMTIKVK